MLTHKQLRAEALCKADVKAEHEKLSDEFTLLDEFLNARSRQGLTQAHVAEKLASRRTAQQFLDARAQGGSAKKALAILAKSGVDGLPE